MKRFQPGQRIRVVVGDLLGLCQVGDLGTFVKYTEHPRWPCMVHLDKLPSTCDCNERCIEPVEDDPNARSLLTQTELIQSLKNLAPSKEDVVTHGS